TVRYLVFGILFSLIVGVTSAQGAVIERCTNTGIQQRTPEFMPNGIILTAFDAESLWVYDISRDTRYPLPETRPCNGTCHLSPNAQELIYLNPETYIFSVMRVDGTFRTPLVSNASEVQWWAQDILLVWTPDQRVYLRFRDNAPPEPDLIPADGVRTIQPGGRYGVRIQLNDGVFNRYLVNLDDVTQATVYLSPDRPYFNASAWSPSGQYLAYVGDGTFDSNANITGSELYLIQTVADSTPQQLTNLHAVYGAARINGYNPSDLSWSPDNTRVAFWVINLLGSNPQANTAEAVLHMVDIRTGETFRYCAFSTAEHTPETPRIIWSPDGSHMAFAGDVEGDGKGALLLAVNANTGQFTELSDGMFPVYGIPQLTAWGVSP
ncbi:MAG: hypothetical protein AAFQ52_19110, partial [Chloroflexota bacterium]